MPQIQYLLLYLPLLIISFTVHEFGHAWVALKQGDDTAYRLGRVTLNPAAHIDPIGSLLLPGIAALTGMPVLGWARPVPVTTRNFRDYRRGDLLTSAAGVAGNALLILAFALIGELATAGLVYSWPMGDTLEIVRQMCWLGGILNASLIVFNLIPVPPLDGSRIIVHYLSARGAQTYAELSRYGVLILYGLLFMGGFNFIGPLARAMNEVVVNLVDLPFGLQ
ncbi:MAG TPA: site-2 protease family protein [Longimicrobiaceae bacterium]|nr:site-2 protease family protein [Longimicrobiaceae bacterium]